MAQITAKFAGRCACCGRAIAAGTTIEWSRSGGARHIACGTASSARAPKRRASAPKRHAEPQPGETEVYHDASPYTVGQAVLLRDAWLIVTRCGSRRITEGEDDTRAGETRYWAHARAATTEEATAAAAARAEREAAKAAKAAALASITQGYGLGRDARLSDTRVIARAPQGTAFASKPYLLADADHAYHVSPRYDDSPSIARLALTPDQAIEAARVAGWTIAGGAA